jgi:hypothetical protein
MKCINCNDEIPNHMRYCAICGHDAGFPNVRAALRPKEVDALECRVEKVKDGVNSRKCNDILNDFEDAVAKSSVIICARLGKISEFVSSDNSLYQNFYQAIGSEGQLPENNEWDSIREPVDSLLFPHYHKEIRFGSLSINRKGITGYGDCCMTLRDIAIKDRATVFEENTVLFIKKHRIVAGDPMPLGYRASWQKRDLLAVAKLGEKITPETSGDEFPKLLASSNDKDGDFIEVHIYGPIQRRAIEHLSYYNSAEKKQKVRKVDNILFKSISRKLKEINVTTEIFQ